METGNIYAVTYNPTHPETGQPHIIASGLERPVGVAYHNGTLYISAVHKILMIPDVMHHLDGKTPPQTFIPNLPWRAGDHDWKFIAFGPDDRLYVPIGAPCNICATGHDFGKLTRYSADGKNEQDIAFGIRNTVGFTWQPGTNTLWFTDNGRDMLGDDIPSDELNTLHHTGEEFGYPYCHQGDIPDPRFGKQHPCTDFTPPAVKLGAHVAALGVRFYDGTQFPTQYRHNPVIAEHGSWNRSFPVGYRVVSIPLQGGQETILLNGLTKDGDILARPADVQPLPDGSLLVSDDMNGVLYRLTYVTPSKPR